MKNRKIRKALFIWVCSCGKSGKTAFEKEEDARAAGLRHKARCDGAAGEG